MDIEDTKKHQGLMSAVRDIMMKNQNLYQQDLERQYGVPQASPEEIEAQIASNVVDTPDPLAEPENIDPDSVIDGASGVNNELGT